MCTELIAFDELKSTLSTPNSTKHHFQFWIVLKLCTPSSPSCSKLQKTSNEKFQRFLIESMQENSIFESKVCLNARWAACVHCCCAHSVCRVFDIQCSMQRMNVHPSIKWAVKWTNKNWIFECKIIRCENDVNKMPETTKKITHLHPVIFCSLYFLHSFMPIIHLIQSARC